VDGQITDCVERKDNGWVNEWLYVSMYVCMYVCMYEMKNAYKILFGKSYGKRPFGRPRHRWADNINTDFTEIVYDDVNFIELTRDGNHWQALVNMVMNLWVP